MDEARRCGRIVERVLRFASRSPSEKVARDLNAAVRAVRRLPEEIVARAGAEIFFELAADLPPVPLDETEIEQALVNLVRNAVEAGARRVAVRTASSAGKVLLIVEDDGAGMTEEQRQAVFDPFFTTRQKQGGVGLGLSIVHRIVCDHGGTITVESEAGKGARFVLALPGR
jgi:signal transduction histidine kinase